MRIPIRMAGPANGPLDDDTENAERSSSLARPEDDQETVAQAEESEGPLPGPVAGEANEWKDRYIRLLADFENMKRHAEAERERLAGIGKESVLDGVFPLVEHMERAKKAVADAADKAGVLAGLDLVLKQIVVLLDKHGVERVRSVGEVFDPKVHEAVAVVPMEGAEADTVIEEVAPGFIRNGKLLRPAMVVVAK
jgi:molecular chaperone GrpE